MATSLPVLVYLVVSFIVCVPNTFAFTSIPLSQNEINQRFNIIDKWRMKSSVPTASSSSVSEKCLQNTREYLSALHHRLPWAVKSKLN
jgi:hypothetical protein